MLPHSVQGKTQPTPHKQTISAKYTMRSINMGSTKHTESKSETKTRPQGSNGTLSLNLYTEQTQQETRIDTNNYIYIYYIHMDNYYTLFIDTRLALNRIYV